MYCRDIWIEMRNRNRVKDEKKMRKRGKEKYMIKRKIECLGCIL